MVASLKMEGLNLKFYATITRLTMLSARAHPCIIMSIIFIESIAIGTSDVYQMVFIAVCNQLSVEL